MESNKIMLGIVLFSCLFFSGCGFLPKITFGNRNSVPQSIVESSDIVKCAGEIKFDYNGNVLSCSKGFIHQDKDNKTQERKLNFLEKIGNFIAGLQFWGFLILVGVIIFVPGSLGWVLGRLLDATHKAFDETVNAIKEFRKSSPAKEELDNYLRTSQSTKTKAIIAKKRVEITYK